MAKQTLKKEWSCRCAAWSICDQPNCRHYALHEAGIECCWPAYCGVLEGFVQDIPLSEIREAEECDPNLMFLRRKQGGRYR
jgi:hypothetical protein